MSKRFRTAAAWAKTKIKVDGRIRRLYFNDREALRPYLIERYRLNYTDSIRMFIAVREALDTDAQRVYTGDLPNYPPL